MLCRLWILLSILTALSDDHIKSVHSFQSPLPARRKISTNHQLHLSPTNVAAYSVLGHVIGGTTGTPIVLQGTKKGGWYRKIELPSWTPPDIVFGPVWTTLYSCMGFAVARIYNTASSNSKTPLLLWTIHYVLNLLWAPVFFGFKRLRLGLVINGLLIATLAAIIPMFYSIDTVSAYLLVPYFGWLLFAIFLNYAICKLNPTVQGYNNAKLQADIIKLQNKAAEFAGL